MPPAIASKASWESSPHPFSIWCVFSIFLDGDVFSIDISDRMVWRVTAVDVGGSRASGNYADISYLL